MKILIFGLPGSGKTWPAERLVQNIDNCAWYNADNIITLSNFSINMEPSFNNYTSEFLPQEM